MKATGIIRRIDELGRIVIPKEIRRTLHFREGDPVEIYTDSDGGVVLKKYSVLGDIKDYAADFTDSLHRSLGATAIITDKENIVAASGQGKKDFIGKQISNQLLSYVEGRKGIKTDRKTEKSPIPLTENDSKNYISQCILPILSSGDVLGSVIIISDNESLGDTAYKNAETAAYFLGTQNE